jgi:hypothetical protein
MLVQSYPEPFYRFWILLGDIAGFLVGGQIVEVLVITLLVAEVLPAVRPEPKR